MNNSDIKKGNELMIFMEDAAIAFAKNHTLSLTANTVDISSKDHGDFAPQIPTTISWEATTENLTTESGFTKLRDAMLKKDTVTIAFAPCSNYDANGIVGTDTTWVAGTAWTTGEAYITSLQITAQNGELSTMSATFTGATSLAAGTTSGS